MGYKVPARTKGTIVMGKHTRRRFTSEMKRQIVSEIEMGIMSVSEASRKHQIHPTLIQVWRYKASQGQFQDRPADEVVQLEKENRFLKEKVAELYLHVELLKKAATLAERKKSASLSVITGKNLAQFKKAAE
jgi:transposase-like protein